MDRRRIDGLTTEDRSAHVVNDVWLRAVRTVLQWAVTRERLPSNPFAGATVELPLARLRGPLRQRYVLHSVSLRSE